MTMPRHQPHHGEHRHGYPGERVAGLQRPVLLNVAQEPGDEHNRGQVHELKHKNGQARMMMFRLLGRQASRWIRLQDPSHHAAATRKSPATNIATITPEFNQSSRSP